MFLATASTDGMLVRWTSMETPAMTECRILQPGDEELLDSFLREHAASSMFLRSNCRLSGLVPGPEPFQGTYAAAVEDDAIVGVAAHFWNGMIIVQAPAALESVVRHVATETGAPVRGFGGPWSQVRACRSILGFDDDRTGLCGQEDLFHVDLDEVSVPPALASGAVTCRPVADDELELVADWHVDYCLEALGRARDPKLEEHCLSEMHRLQREGNHWVAEHDGDPVSYACLNAQLPDCVQIGGVWTPPAHRSRGYARAAVAGCLLAVRERGVRSSILFTPTDNIPAQRAYLSIGYRIVGDYGLMMFETPRPFAGVATEGDPH